MSSSRKLHIALLLALCALCFFWRLGSVGLFDFNEGIYVQVSREMYLHATWVTPLMNGWPWFDKPPLALWCAIVSFHLFGISEFAARLPVALASSGVVLLTYVFGSRYLSERAGFLAGAMVALNPLFLGTARQMTMDIHQTFWFLVAMVCFFLGYTARTASGKRWYYGFWAGCGLSFMAKSAPGLIPIFIALAFVVLSERLRVRAILARIWEAKLLLGIPLMLAVILPWHLLMYRANGSVFVQEYFFHHNVQILNGKDFGHAGPFWYYLPGLLGSFFPWSVFLPWAVWAGAWASRRPVEHGSGSEPSPLTDRIASSPLEHSAAARLLILVWAVIVFVLFSGMVSKLVSYLLPMFPAAALLVADWMDRAIESPRDWGLRIGASATALFAAGFAVTLVWALHHYAGTTLETKLYEAIPPAVIRFALHGLMVGGIGAVVSAALLWFGQRSAGAYALIGTMAAFTLLSVSEGLSALEAEMNAPLQSLAREAARGVAAGTPILVHIAGPTRPSVLFYLPDEEFVRRAVRGRDDMGLVASSGAKEDADRFLAEHRPAYVLTDARRAEALMSSRPDLRIQNRHGRWLLLRTGEPIPVLKDGAPEGAALRSAKEGHA